MNYLPIKFRSMVVRTRVELECLPTKTKISTVAVLNAGFGTAKPHCLIPSRLAQLLKIWPELPAGTRIKPFETSGGMIKLCWIQDGIMVRLIQEKSILGEILCDLVISELEREVLLSDSAIEKLNICLEAPASGLWRLRGSSEIFTSPDAEYW